MIWATQVLETLNKSGIATRSEVTDAAHAAHAECVMLNKGPFVTEAVRALDRLLALYADKPVWKAMQKRAMQADFGWSAAAAVKMWSRRCWNSFRRPMSSRLSRIPHSPGQLFRAIVSAQASSSAYQVQRAIIARFFP